MNMEWISVKDTLPEIPEGRYGIRVIVASFDHVYAEISGNGYDVFQASYGKIRDRKGNLYPEFAGSELELDFYQVTEIGPYPIIDEVTHWMYMPEPPKYITKSEVVAGNDICPECGYTWDDHEFGVPAPYCPTSFVPPKPSKVKNESNI